MSRLKMAEKTDLGTHFFFHRLADLADEDKVFIGSLFLVNIGTNTMIPRFTSLTENPNDSAIGVEAALLAGCTEGSG